MLRTYTPEDLEKISHYLSKTELPDTTLAIHISVNLILSHSDELHKKDLEALARLHSFGMLLCDIWKRHKA